MTDEKQITLTHLNIRQSISILIFKLILIDIVMAGLIIFFYLALTQGEQIIPNLSTNTMLFFPVFIALGLIKITLDCYVIMQWLNEYYEITPEYAIHKTGVVYKKEQRYRLANIRMIAVIDSVFGEIFNFGTIVLYDIRLNKYFDMYLIHNPRRYAKVLKHLKPELEIREDHVWLPILEKRRESLDDEVD